MSKDKPRRTVRVHTKDGDVRLISGDLADAPSWAGQTPMPPAPSEKYTEPGDDL